MVRVGMIYYYLDIGNLRNGGIIEIKENQLTQKQIDHIERYRQLPLNVFLSWEAVQIALWKVTNLFKEYTELPKR